LLLAAEMVLFSVLPTEQEAERIPAETDHIANPGRYRSGAELRMTENEEQWYVHDFCDGFQYFKTEQEAHDCFIKSLNGYREAAEGDEWADEVEHVTWGKIYQSVVLKRVVGTENDEYALHIIERRKERS
jgi:hypothetical protein